MISVVVRFMLRNPVQNINLPKAHLLRAFNKKQYFMEEEKIPMYLVKTKEYL